MTFGLLLTAFDDPDRAAMAARALRRLGVSSGQISRWSADPEQATPAAEPRSGSWSSRFGRDLETSRVRRHRRALRDGRGDVVGVRVLPDEAGRVRALLDTFGQPDVEEPPILHSPGRCPRPPGNDRASEPRSRPVPPEPVSGRRPPAPGRG